MINLIGRTPIHPMFFYTGKIFGYITWILFSLSIFKIDRISRHSVGFLIILSYVLAVIGLIIVIISLINLPLLLNIFMMALMLVLIIIKKL